MQLSLTRACFFPPGTADYEQVSDEAEPEQNAHTFLSDAQKADLRSGGTSHWDRSTTNSPTPIQGTNHNEGDSESGA